MKKPMHNNLALLMGSLGLFLTLTITMNVQAENTRQWYPGFIELQNGTKLKGEIAYVENHTRFKDVIFFRKKQEGEGYFVRGYYFGEIHKVVFYDKEWQVTRTLARYNERFYEKLVGNSDDFHFLVVPHKHLGGGLEQYSYLSYFFWEDGEIKYVHNFPKQFRKICEKYQVDYCEFIKNTKLSPNDPGQQHLLVYYFNKWRKNTNLIVRK